MMHNSNTNPNQPDTMITITEHERTEWSRLAAAAYKAGNNDIGHKFSAAAAYPAGTRIAVSTYHPLQEIYREWLVFNTLPA